MTEQEKELFNKFHYQICNANGISESGSTEMCAKQCVSICVDEILKTNTIRSKNDWYKFDLNSKKFKRKLEKLEKLTKELNDYVFEISVIWYKDQPND